MLGDMGEVKWQGTGEIALKNKPASSIRGRWRTVGEGRGGGRW